MNRTKIRSFLLQQPKASLIRVSSSDSVPQEIRPQGRSLAKISETIEALGPELVECLDKDGRLIRAMRAELEDGRRSDAAEIPVGLAADPQALQLTHFANLLHRAYEHSTEIAFVKLVELVERIDQRSDAIEQRLERTEANYRRALEQQVDDAFDRAHEVAEQAGEGDMTKQMAMAFLQGQMQPPAPNGANGKVRK